MRPKPHIRARRAQRAATLKTLGYASYSDYLRSPHWQQVKVRYRASDLPQACMCGETDVHLHHMTYERIGDERLTDLTPLCARCHSLIHVLEFRGEITLDLAGMFDQGRAIEGRALLVELVAEQERQRCERIEGEQQEVLALPYATRLLRVARQAKYKRRIDISSQLHVLKHMAKTGRSDEVLTRHLRRIEERVYGWDGWQDAA